MNGTLIGLSLVSALLASSAPAITLQWLGGSTDISFTAATRCTLVMAVAPPDTALPRDVRLSWVAQNCADLQVVAENAAAPAGHESRVDEVVDRNELESGCRFQNVRVSSASSHSTVARYVLELPATARGKLRAQAQRSDGTLDVSNTVTFNSGIAAPFAPVVFASRTSIEGDAVVIRARGTGLASSRAVRLVTADTSWSARFDLVQQDDTSLTARNSSLSTLPEALVQVTNVSGAGSAIAGSSAASPAAPAAFSGSVVVTDPTNPSAVMKDFAFVYEVSRNPATNKWEGLYHVYYIRQTGSGDAAVGRVLAHTFTPDLALNWSIPDTTEFVAGAGGGAWDASEVWAPSLIKRGGLWYLFYTGLDAAKNQSIGYATKASLRPNGSLWQRRTAPVLTKLDVPYVDPVPPVQLRDPFVIEDPDLPGRLLLMYTAKNDPAQGLPLGYTIGVSRSAGSLDSWTPLGRYVDSDYAHSFDIQDESPHAFRDPNVSTHWRLMWTAAFAPFTRSIDFEQNLPTALLSTTAPGNWGLLTHLYSYTNSSVGYGWAGSEFLHTGDYLQAAPGVAPYGYTDFLAGYLQAGSVSGIEISKLSWGPVITTFPAHQDFTLDLSGSSDFRVAENSGLRA